MVDGDLRGAGLPSLGSQDESPDAAVLGELKRVLPDDGHRAPHRRADVTGDVGALVAVGIEGAEGDTGRV